jgi:hypothetical protein
LKSLVVGGPPRRANDSTEQGRVSSPRPVRPRASRSRPRCRATPR